jgi:hypothetical protein
VVDPDEEEMMEDGADIVRPMQKQLEEYLSHDVARYFDSKLHWKCGKIVIKHDQYLTYRKSRVPFQDILNALQEELEVEGSW